MNTTDNLVDKQAVDKLRSLVEAINVCLFCTDLATQTGSTCRPMSAIKVCDQGNIWFFSEKDSDKNKSIEADNRVQLFFSQPVKDIFLVVCGEATVLFDPKKVDELWTAAAKIWFKQGKEDPSISIIKVKPSSAYYWDTDGNRMINMLKMITSVVTGNDLLKGKEGTLTI